MSRNFIQKEKHYWIKILIDGILLLAAFFLVYYIRRGHIQIELNFRRFLPYLIISWFVVSIFSKKFKEYKHSNLYSKLNPYFFSVLALTAVISVVLFIQGWMFLSRFIVYFTLGFFALFEILFDMVRTFFRKDNGIKPSMPYSVTFFLFELFLISSVLATIHFYRRRGLQIREEYEVLFLGIYFVWIIISLLIHKFEFKKEKKLVRILIPYWKSEIITIGLVTFFIIITNLDFVSQTIVLGSLLGFAVLENLIVLFLYMVQRKKIPDTKDCFPLPFPDEKIVPLQGERAAEIKEKYKIPDSTGGSDLFSQKLQKTFLSQTEEVFHFLEQKIDLSSVDILETLVNFMEGADQINFPEDGSLSLFFNLSPSNDLRHLNKALIEINRKLKQGGVFIGKFESLEQNKKKFLDKYPYILANLFYPFYFFFKRIMPKMPLLSKIYFFITKGRRRIISKAEILGRLNFCGFEMIGLCEFEDFNWFIVYKHRDPLKDQHPSYGPIFKQKRIGKDGDLIVTYKFRTMHPYSEYIQDYIFNLHKLDDIGKIRDDFRITSWGRIFRKLWIDEIPMLVNILRGEIKLVGVRPLSVSFFNSYPEKLKKKRIRYKPGLIPPFYADMPETIEEVWESEERYLDSYQERPRRTDLSYFFRILKNIFFHHSKSG
ncbi:sugar transferase [Acidobacteriota bacterium]